MRTLGSQGGQILKTVAGQGMQNLRSLESAKSTPSRKFILPTQTSVGPNISKSEGQRRGSEEGRREGEEGGKGSVREGIQRLEERRKRVKEEREGEEEEKEERQEERERTRSSEIIRTRSASERRGQRSVKIKSSWTCYLDGPDEPVRQVSEAG